MQPIKAGVTQGSILGPVLFLLFVNGLSLFVNETYLEMYTDDTTFHYANKDKKVLQLKLQNGAATFNHWCISNDMFVSWLKTSLMMLGTRQNLSNSLMMLGTRQNLSNFDLVDVYLESQCIQHVELRNNSI